ncbi:hypothetical protein TWF694_011289 [Orbilia ellipsospora]|uniref:Uncharacterized protein n=1 Tax=Orbilia ellipsospora TaxID=2528407 RepID=A0AAV9XEY2_9PEZI
MINLIACTTLLLAAGVTATTMTRDNTYSNSENRNLTSFRLSCYNYLYNQTGAQTTQQLNTILAPGAYVAGTPFVEGNSTECGRCYRARNPKNNKGIYIAAIGASETGVVRVGKEGFAIVNNQTNSDSEPLVDLSNDSASLIVDLSDDPASIIVDLSDGPVSLIVYLSKAPDSKCFTERRYDPESAV